MRAAALLAALIAFAACRDDVRPPPGPSVRVSVHWGGATPGEIEREVLIPLERALVGLPGVEHLHGTATPELATVELTGTTPAEAIAPALAALRASLPVGADAPWIERLDPKAALVMVALVEPGRSALEASAHLREAERTAGLRLREVCGTVEEEVVVTADPERLNAFGLSLIEVVRKLERLDLDDDGRGAIVRVAGRHRRVDQLDRLELAPGVHLRDVATIASGPRGGCSATLDGVPAAIAMVERARGAKLPSDLRVLDGPTLQGELDLGPDQLPRVLSAAHGAIPRPRWFATRYDPDRERLTLSISLDRGDRGAALVAAVDRAIGPGLAVRWRGADLVVATGIVRGPDAREVAPRLAAELRAQPGVAAAGCDPCATHTSQTLHLNDTRLAAIGASRADVTRLAMISRGGLVIGGGPSMRLVVPDDVDVLALRVPTDSAGFVPLGDFLTVETDQVPSAGLRVDAEVAVELWARAAPGTSAAALRKLVEGKVPAAR